MTTETIATLSTAAAPILEDWGLPIALICGLIIFEAVTIGLVKWWRGGQDTPSPYGGGGDGGVLGRAARSMMGPRVHPSPLSGGSTRATRAARRASVKQTASLRRSLVKAYGGEKAYESGQSLAAGMEGLRESEGSRATSYNYGTWAKADIRPTSAKGGD